MKKFIFIFLVFSLFSLDNIDILTNRIMSEPLGYYNKTNNNEFFLMPISYASGQDVPMKRSRENLFYDPLYDPNYKYSFYQKYKYFERNPYLSAILLADVMAATISQTFLLVHVLLP